MKIQMTFDQAVRGLIMVRLETFRGIDLEIQLERLGRDFSGDRDLDIVNAYIGICREIDGLTDYEIMLWAHRKGLSIVEALHAQGIDTTDRRNREDLIEAGKWIMSS